MTIGNKPNPKNLRGFITPVSLQSEIESLAGTFHITISSEELLEWYDKYCDFLATGAYPYHSDVAMYFNPTLTRETQEQSKEHTLSYICSKLHERASDLQRLTQLQKDGWKLFECDFSNCKTNEDYEVIIDKAGCTVIQSAIDGKCKVELFRRGENILMGMTEKTVKYNPIIHNGKAYLMSPHARKSAIPVSQFYNKGWGFPSLYRFVKVGK